MVPDRNKKPSSVGVMVFLSFLRSYLFLDLCTCRRNVTCLPCARISSSREAFLFARMKSLALILNRFLFFVLMSRFLCGLLKVCSLLAIIKPRRDSS